MLLLLCLSSFLTFAGDNPKGFSTSGSLLFIENNGQLTDQYDNLRDDIDIKVETPGMNIFIGNGQLHYQWAKTDEQAKKPVRADDLDAIMEMPEPVEVSFYRMDVILEGANPDAELIKSEPDNYYENYYLPYAEDGITAKSYRKVTYKNIYPHIDWVLYTEEGNVLKYDFIIRPGGDPADIRIRYAGATSIQLQDGAITATTPYGSITENAPYTYSAATKERIASSYNLDGNTISFNIAAAEGTIIIDPQLEWATYYGGSTGYNDVRCDSYDEYGNVYLTGSTNNSSSTLITSGAFQTTKSDSTDSYLVKFNSAGIRQWSTYFGGNGADVSFVTALDVDGNIYIGGSTTSTNVIATSGSFQASHTQFIDGFVEKFSTSGQRIWGTYIGGYRDEVCQNINIDVDGNIFISGITNSKENIATAGTHQDSLNSGVSAHPDHSNDVYIMKFDKNMNRMWGTYYGGYKSENIHQMVIDNIGGIYIAGSTMSYNSIATTGTHQRYLNGSSTSTGGTDAYISKFDTSGIQVWGTYFGGVAGDYGLGINLDDSLNIYLAGFTFSDIGIATAGTHQPSHNSGQQTGCLAKFTNSGNRIWGTYYNYNTWPRLIVVAPYGKVYIGGETYSKMGIATQGGFQSSITGSDADLFMAVFTNNGIRTWGTYYGGSSIEQNLGGANQNCKYRGAVYLHGFTVSNGLATQNAHQTTSGPCGIIAKISFDTSVSLHDPIMDTVMCPGDTFKVAYYTNLPFATGNSFKIQLSDSSGEFGNPVIIGSRADTITDTITCVIPTNTIAGSKYRIRILADSPSYISFRSERTIRIKAAPDSLAAFTNAPVCMGDTLLLSGSTTSSGVSWLWTGTGYSSLSKDTTIVNADTSLSGVYILSALLGSTGCTLYDTLDVLVNANPTKPIAGSNSPVCQKDAIHLSSGTSTTGVTYEWYGPSSFTSSQKDTIISSATTADSGLYIVRVMKSGCVNYDTISVLVQPPTPTPLPGANTPVCIGQDLKLTASTVAGASYHWSGSGYTSLFQNPVRNNVTSSYAGKYFISVTLNGCSSDTDSVAVIVNPAPFVSIFPSPSDSICKNEPVILTAIPNNAGSTPSYNWYINSQWVGSAVTYASTTLKNNDVIYCEMTDTTKCRDPFTDSSNTLRMTVSPWLAPSVSISATPPGPYSSGQLVTFNANASDAGNNPAYQWQRNGNDIVGAQSSIWSANTLNSNDTVSVIVTSNYKCPQPSTASSNVIVIQMTSVNDMEQRETLLLYPSPNNGTFTLKGEVSTTKPIHIEIINSIGQKVYKDVANIKRGIVDKTIQLNALPAGNYFIKLYNDEVEQTTGFAITQ